jgi:hypothetical protein
LPVAKFPVLRRYLIVMPRPLPTALFLVRRRYLAVVLRPALRLMPAATRRIRNRRMALGK